MIKVTDVAGRDKYINCDLIERIEANPDTVVFLANGHNVILRDKPEEIVEKVVAFKRRCLEGSMRDFSASTESGSDPEPPAQE